MNLGNLAGIGGVDMGLGMSLTGSQMGLDLRMGPSGSMGPARIDDEERRKRLESVIAKLRERPGRVSEEGIERVAQRCGMAVETEPKGDNSKVLLLAGEALLIEVC